MKDWSSSLPTWAYYKGYRLVGRLGTYDELYLLKDQIPGFEVSEKFTWVRKFGYHQVPSIAGLEELLHDIESQKATT